jgi:hypothetical protein
VARRDPVDDRPSAGRSAGRHEHEPRRPGHQHPSEDAAQIEGVVQDAFDDGMVVVTAAGTTAATRATSRPRATRPPSLSARSKVRRSTRVVLELRSLRRSVRSRRVDHVRLEFIEYPDQHVQRKTPLSRSWPAWRCSPSRAIRPPPRPTSRRNRHQRDLCRRGAGRRREHDDATALQPVRRTAVGPDGRRPDWRFPRTTVRTNPRSLTVKAIAAAGKEPAPVR